MPLLVPNSLVIRTKHNNTSSSSAGGPMSRIPSAWSVLIRRPIVTSDIEELGGSEFKSHWRDDDNNFSGKYINKCSRF